MRAACREHLDNARPMARGPFAFMTELGRLRAIFGVQVAYLAVKYGINLHGELARIIPPDLRDANFAEK